MKSHFIDQHFLHIWELFSLTNQLQIAACIPDLLNISVVDLNQHTIKQDKYMNKLGFVGGSENEDFF